MNNQKKVVNNENQESKRLITAALPYINNVPHLGHIVGSHLPADIFARYSRARGFDVIFVGGTDENGSTSEIAAEKAGVDIETFSDKLYEIHKKSYEWFNISYDNFSRTSRKIHHETAQEFFRKIYDNDYINKDKIKVFYSPKEDRYLPDRYVKGTCNECGYEEANGDQCENCTAVLDAEKLLNPKSVISGESVEIKEVEHLFIRLDKLQDSLDKWIASKEGIWRSNVLSLAKSWINQGLKPRCITRDLKHGVSVPIDGFKDKVMYVWFEAPIGYVSSTKEVSEEWESYWKGNAEIFNFLGKDNIPFHTIFWPGICIAHGEISLAKNVIGLQYLNYEGGKFSKSKKRGVFCEKISESGIGPDIWRGYLTKLIPETDDSEFKWSELRDFNNSELLGNYGNFLNRTLKFIKTKLDNQIKKPFEEDLSEEDKSLLEKLKTKSKNITDYLERCELRRAFNEVLSLCAEGNRYFNNQKPWEVINEDKKRANNILYLCLELNRNLSILFNPFIPEKTTDAWKQMNLKGSPEDKGNWETLGDFKISDNHEIGEPKALFRKLDDEELEKVRNIVSDVRELEELFK